MDAEKIVEHLQQIPAFEGLTDKDGELELYHVAEIVTEATYKSEDQLFVQGERSDRLYLILEGGVRLTRVDREGVTRYLGDLTPGDTVGLTGLLVGDFHDATATALTDTHVLLLEQESFTDLLDERPRLRRRMHVPSELKRRQVTPEFDWLRPDELVIFSERRHWAQLARRIFPPLIVLAIMIPLLYFLLSATTWAAGILSIILVLVTLVILITMVWLYIDWRDDSFVLTTQRVVHFEQVWPVSEAFEESALENIQDIHEVQSGVAANILNFGDLILQTAGETVQIDLTGIANPAYLRELIFKEIERNRAQEILRMRGAIREKLESRLLDKAPPPEEEKPSPEPEKPSSIKLLMGALKDYFFPPSWTISADNNTIYWRRFWLAGFFRHLAIFVPLALLTIGGLIFLPNTLQQDPDKLWMLIVWLILEGALFATLLWFIEDWRNDYFEVTPNRIIQVDRKPLLLQEKRRETTLDRIQNISFDIPDFMARFFKYGNVMLETAGTLGKFELKSVRYPDKIQAEISKRQREYSKHQQEIKAEQRQEEMLSWFATYHNLSDKIKNQPKEPDTGSGQPAQTA